MTLLELAERRAKALEYVRALGMQNAYGRTPEEQIRASAQYRIATDAAAQADADYRAAIAGLSAEELAEAART